MSQNSNVSPLYCSDVPGPIMNLCWNPKIPTFFPRRRYIMNNSLNKWPQGYKGFVSAVVPASPVLTLDASSNFSVTLSWTVSNNVCVPISSFNIYQNGVLISVIPYPLTSTTIFNLQNNLQYTFYITSVSNTTQSSTSNTVVITLN